MLTHELLENNPDIVPEEAPLIILDSKCAVCMDKNGKDTKHTRNITRKVHFLGMVKISKCTRLTNVKDV